jgi:hypothetical protein
MHGIQSVHLPNVQHILSSFFRGRHDVMRRVASGSWILGQSSRYYVTCVQNAKRKIFLFPHSLFSKNFLFLCRTSVSKLWKIYAYIHISDWVDIAFELTLFPNYTANETFLRKSGGMGSVTSVFVIEATSCGWLKEYVTLDKRCTILLSNRT